LGTQESQIYEFDDFRLDATERMLLRSGEPVLLTPRVFDTLLYLVRHQGRVLEKDELMRALWPDAFVEENNLTQNVSTLRRALGEAKGENRYIVTVPGRGYRFAADVKTVTGEAAPIPEAAVVPAQEAPAAAPVEIIPPPQPQLISRRKIIPLALLLVLIAAGLGLITFYFWRVRSRTTSGRPVRTIAVLPFKSLVAVGRDEALEMGMADTLVTRLSNIREVLVSPVSSVRRYGGLEQDPLAAGRELGVEAVLDGTIQRRGDRIRVTARLIRVGDGQPLWADHFDERFTDIFQVQDSITERVAGQLVPQLTGEERARLTKQYTDDAEAYELYVKGQFFWGKRTREGDEQALNYYRMALDRDPDYALAHAGLAEYYRALPISRDVPAREAMPRAQEAARRALDLDEGLAEAHTALGWIKFFYDWDWEGSEKEHRRALEINPNLPAAHVGFATLLSCLGRHDEALGEMDRAHRLDPVSPLAGALRGQSLFLARRYAEAVEHLRQVLEINPNSWIGWLQLGRSDERLGRYDEALEAFRKATESGGTTEALSLAGYTYAVSGRREDAERSLREMAAISKRSYLPPYNVALVHLGLGRTDEALRWLERAYEEKDAHLVLLGVEPKWSSLRGTAGYLKLLERMGLLR
jgi:DNA-binding winged helix-turn-helix (wHTH) protein/TolB-like protein/tetratricopeptide (TPR) repeat protein